MTDIAVKSTVSNQKQDALSTDDAKPGARVTKQRRITSLVQLHKIGRPAGTKLHLLVFLFPLGCMYRIKESKL